MEIKPLDDILTLGLGQALMGALRRDREKAVAFIYDLVGASVPSDRDLPPGINLTSPQRTYAALLFRYMEHVERAGSDDWFLANERNRDSFDTILDGQRRMMVERVLQAEAPFGSREDRDAGA